MKLPFNLYRHGWIAFSIGLLALVVRILFVLYYPVHPLAGGDPAAFWSFAQGIVSGHGFHSTIEPWLADRPPLYSFFLAGIFWLFGEDHLTVFFVQASVGALAASLFYICVVRIVGDFGGLMAGTLYAIFPHFILYTKQILTEALYIPLWVILLALLFLTKVEIKTGFQWWLAGISLGLLTLTRREALLPAGIVVFLVIWLRTRPKWNKAIRGILVAFLFAGVVILPWLVRNWLVLGKPIISSSGGVNFMVGNNPLANGGYTPPPADWAAQFQGLNELERDQKAWDLSLQWIRDNPADFIRLLPKKFAGLCGPAHNLGLDSFDIFLVLFCLPGLIRVMLRKDGWLIVAVLSLLPMLTTTIIGLVFVGGWRYRLIVYPGLLLLAGYGAVQVVSWYFSVVDLLRKRRANALAS